MKLLQRVLLNMALLSMFLTATMSSVYAGGTTVIPSVSLAVGESKTVPFMVRNEDTVSHQYQLSGTGTAEYEMYFSFQGNSVKGIHVSPKGETVVDLNIRMLALPREHIDGITVTAQDEQRVRTEVHIPVLVRNDYVLTASSQLNHASVQSGKTIELTVAVKNAGSKPLHTIGLKADLPYKWIAQPSSAGMPVLKPGESGIVKVLVEVPPTQVSGNFAMKVSAVSDETQGRPISIPVTVQSSSGIAPWMIGALILVIIFTVAQFKQHGRR